MGCLGRRSLISYEKIDWIDWKTENGNKVHLNPVQLCQMARTPASKHGLNKHQASQR